MSLGVFLLDDHEVVRRRCGHWGREQPLFGSPWELTAGLRSLADANPSVMGGFNRVHRAATTSAALSQIHTRLGGSPTHG
jgi:hypothetical protein